ncbi:hypothetical protein, variant 1 [Aphanomyces astaci]|uniref:Major facilitator superfamily (MFS) profile domain-containing protein n=1 Tax=Aphanomyces astaci TaxID=112090 RepID=W4FDV2_APHAT|nr:hypothetical protein, variant 1 [Aphanomyces astaci]ETV65011.1 hypothetical protein, variant 1 [Aphanomyces astaci]|eukprot:XP_009845501.1 hypothetical protein, variant 1 [Aphanomyces astaci]
MTMNKSEVGTSSSHRVLLPPSSAEAAASMTASNDVRRRPLSKTALRKEASYVFKYLLFAQVTVYLETGTIPCLLDSFAVVFNMNAREQGWLGSVVYISLCAASPLSAIAYKHVDAKYVLGISLVLNNLCVLGFAMTPTGYDNSSIVLITMRALIGFTQSFLCVYTPLWVDAFSPRGSVAGWMSYLQGSVPLGVMFGYLFGSVSNWLSTDMCFFQCWRWPFLLQFVLVVPLMIGVFFVPTEHLNIIMSTRKKQPLPIPDKALPRPPSFNTTTHDVAERQHTHPVMLEEMVLPRRSTSYSNLSFRNAELNPAQFTAIRASYTTPRFRMDSYDIDFVDDPELVSSSSHHHNPPHHVPNAPMSLPTYGTTSNTLMEPVTTPSSSLPHSAPPEIPPPPPPFKSAPSLHETTLPSSLTQAGVVRPPTTVPVLRTTSSRRSFRGYRACSSRVIMDEFDEDEQEEDDIDVDMGFFHSLRVLLLRPLFTLIVLGLSAIYFVVTGVQFWSTIYLQRNFNASVVIVNGLFVVVAGTGPIWGVFFGGALIDRAGGYMGLHQRAKALGICVCLGFVAFSLGIVTTFLPNLYLTAASLWLVLFFGGSILPSCTGIFISATPVHLRSLASSVSVMVFNLLGYALAPALTGSFMELIHNNQDDPHSYWYECDEACMYRVGFRCCLAWSVWSLLAMLAAYIVAKRQAAAAIRTGEPPQHHIQRPVKAAMIMH